MAVDYGIISLYCDSVRKSRKAEKSLFCRLALSQERKKDNFMENEREKDFIAGRNAVTEALKSGRPIDSIFVRRGDKTGSIHVILKLAKQAGVTVKEADPKKLDAMCSGENHQGVIAVAAVHAFSEVEDIFRLAEERGEAPFIIVCDEIGSMADARATLGAANCGVPLIASAHAATLQELLERPAIKLLHRAHVFGKYIGLSRRTTNGLEYDVTDWQDICTKEK